MPSGGPHVAIATVPPGLVTRRASASALPGFPAYWKELNPVTASNDASAKGSASSSPVMKVPVGTRRRAMASMASEASSPVTRAPRDAAICEAIPAPQPASSRIVPGATFSRSSTSSNTGLHCPSCKAAQSSTRDPQRTPLTSAVGFDSLAILTSVMCGERSGNCGTSLPCDAHHAKPVIMGSSVSPVQTCEATAVHGPHTCAVSAMPRIPAMRPQAKALKNPPCPMDRFARCWFSNHD